MKTLIITIILILLLNNQTEKHSIYNSVYKTIDIQNIVKTPKNSFKIDSIYIGIKYTWGGTSKKGFDCSGLIQQIYKDNNIDIPRNSRKQALIGKDVPFDKMVKGDLLFYKRSSNGKTTNRISHVSMYIGNNKIIHSISKGVSIDSIGSKVWNNYWKKRLVVIKRII